MYEDRLVGTLALTANHKVAFEYDDAWLEEGFSISRFSLPLKKQVFIPNKDYFEGLFGVFADSLPDAWGTPAFAASFAGCISSSQDDWTVLDRLAVVREDLGWGR
ncbi:MAG: HipA N-terminal domain-containing protein [Clostridium fessum]